MTPWLDSGEVHRQRGVALLQQTRVGHEVRGPDDPVTVRPAPV